MSFDSTLQFDQTPPLKKATWQLLMARRSRQVEAWPKLEAQWTSIKVDPKHLQEYQSLCLLPQEEKLPLLYPFVLAFRLQFHLLAHPEFPLKMIGAVHLRNHCVQKRELSSSEILSFFCTLNPVYITEKGLEFSIQTQAKSEEELVWECCSTFFVRGSFGEKNEKPPPFSTLFEALEEEQKKEPTASWSIPKNLTKKYAALIGDYNPIHISTLFAKLFGFKGKIAHGSSVAAMLLPKLLKSPKSSKNSEKEAFPLRYDIAFKGPVYLGSDVQLYQQGEAFELYCGENPKPSIQGRLHSNATFPLTGS